MHETEDIPLQVFHILPWFVEGVPALVPLDYPQVKQLAQCLFAQNLGRADTKYSHNVKIALQNIIAVVVVRQITYILQETSASRIQ